VVGMRQWADIKRMVLVEGRSQGEVARRRELAWDIVAGGVRSNQPCQKYMRSPLPARSNSMNLCGTLPSRTIVSAPKPARSPDSPPKRAQTTFRSGSATASSAECCLSAFKVRRLPLSGERAHRARSPDTVWPG
jgi:hypothetical protein